MSHNAYAVHLISPHHTGILSSHIIIRRGERSTVRYFERKRDHAHLTFTIVYLYNCSILLLVWGFPGGSDGKESACNAGDLGSIPELGRSLRERNGNSLQYSFWEMP